MAEDFEMASLLASLQESAELDSSGSFSFDSSRSALLLEKFQLPAPAYFMLHGVGAAVASGSSLVDIRLRSDLFQVDFDGVTFSAEEMDHCLAGLWSRQLRPEVVRLRELALARAGATRWSAQPLQYQSNGKKQSLKVYRSDWSSRLRHVLRSWGRQEEEDLLRQHLVPLPTCLIQLNGQRLTSLSLPQQVVRAWTVPSLELPAQLGWELDCEVLAWKEDGWPGDARGLICQLPFGENSPARMTGTLQATFRSYWPGYLDLVLNGRLYRCRLPAAFKNWWAVFWVSGLHRDLSHTFIDAEELTRFHRLIEHCAQL